MPDVVGASDGGPLEGEAKGRRWRRDGEVGVAENLSLFWRDVKFVRF